MSINDLLAVLQEILPDDKVTRQDITAPTPRIKQIYFNFLQEFYFSETLLQVPNNVGAHVHFKPYTLYLIILARRRVPPFRPPGPVLPAPGALPGDHARRHTHVRPQVRPSPSYHIMGSSSLTLLLLLCRFFFFQVKHNEPISFGLTDLIEPDPKRTRRFLAAMANFWSFCNSNYEPTNRIQEEVAARDREIATLGDQVKNATKKIEQLRKRNGEDMIKSQAHEAEEKVRPGDLHAIDIFICIAHCPFFAPLIRNCGRCREISGYPESC